MKKNTFIMYAALLAFGSCTNEVNEEGFVDKANTISFNAYSSKTRAYEAGDVTITQMKEGGFGVVGYKNTDNSLYLGTTTKAVEQVWKTDASTAGGSWEYADSQEMKYWPSGDDMDFVAYFPYSSTGATFAETKSDTYPVMTITNETGNQDVLFSYLPNKTQDDRVHLYFNHALSKLASVVIKVSLPDTEVEVSKVEVLNTSTKGNIYVYSNGNASYKPSDDNDEIRTFDLSSSPKKITLNDIEGVKLFDNNANGYIFATNAALKHNVTGTGKKLWDGIKGNITGDAKLLSQSDLICFKLTCKVKAANEYLVGDANNYGVIYIPMAGTTEQSLPLTELLAGRRYTYNIIMSSNVGYKDNGDPIKHAPIRFSVYEVTDWYDVNVTVTL